VTVPIRDAATVMLVRDAVDEGGQPAIEVCMLRRNLAAEFVAGAYVFPGGSVDPDDRGPAAESVCRGLTDAEASARLGVDTGGLAFWVAALRECFEEAGVLLAYRRTDGAAPGDSGDSLVDTSESGSSELFGSYRDRINAGSTRLLDVCREEDLELAVDGVHYVSHWITPEVAPKRYDTRFFVVSVPRGQVAEHDDGETIASIWVRPTDALVRHDAGEIELLPPTIANLKSLGRFATTADVMAWAEGVTDVPTIQPIVLFEDGRLLVLRPGDDGYEEARAAKEASGSVPEDNLADAVRSAWGPKVDPT
jgi:8-oxo-dGTP pyrophosphatase MutT (NUDIX family)